MAHPRDQHPPRHVMSSTGHSTAENSLSAHPRGESAFFFYQTHVMHHAEKIEVDVNRYSKHYFSHGEKQGGKKQHGSARARYKARCTRERGGGAGSMLVYGPTDAMCMVLQTCNAGARLGARVGARVGARASPRGRG
eukprot:1027491-Rhodomonas_salina.1